MSALAPPNQPVPLTPTLLIAAEEFAQRYSHLHAELVKGVVMEMPVPFPKHGYICLTIGSHMRHLVRNSDLGYVMSNDSFVKTRSNPDTVRGADICYYSYERLPR